MFDIVIPVGPYDINKIKNQLVYTKINIVGYRNIYLILNKLYFNLLSLDKDIHLISEDSFPFSKLTIEQFHGENNRNGWYFQQLLKLYAGLIIPNILDKYLVIDADTFFLKKTTFIENNKCLYNFSFEYYIPYFEHMNKLSNDFIKKFDNKSGICHHMIFETKIINEIFNIIENIHNDFFYNIFLKNVNYDEITKSGASEYEIYFNFIFNKYPDNVILRHLNYIDTNDIKELNNKNVDYISMHHYL